MKNLKKITALLLIVLLAVSIFCLPASAANTSDTKFSFALDPSKSANTAPRRKDNDSAIYVYLQGAPSNGAELRGYAALNANSTNPISVTSTTLVMYEGQKGLIHQYIYERGYRYAILNVKSLGPYTRSVYGLWSPDYSGNTAVDIP